MIDRRPERAAGLVSQRPSDLRRHLVAIDPQRHELADA
jgi:hypothetical protein